MAQKDAIRSLVERGVTALMDHYLKKVPDPVCQSCVKLPGDEIVGALPGGLIHCERCKKHIAKGEKAILVREKAPAKAG